MAAQFFPHMDRSQPHHFFFTRYDVSCAFAVHVLRAQFERCDDMETCYDGPFDFHIPKHGQPRWETSKKNTYILSL